MLKAVTLLQNRLDNNDKQLYGFLHEHYCEIQYSTSTKPRCKKTLTADSAQQSAEGKRSSNKAEADSSQIHKSQATCIEANIEECDLCARTVKITRNYKGEHFI